MNATQYVPFDGLKFTIIHVPSYKGPSLWEICPKDPSDERMRPPTSKTIIDGFLRSKLLHSKVKFLNEVVKRNPLICFHWCLDRFGCPILKDIGPEGLPALLWKISFTSISEYPNITLILHLNYHKDQFFTKIILYNFFSLCFCLGSSGAAKISWFMIFDLTSRKKRFSLNEKCSFNLDN